MIEEVRCDSVDSCLWFERHQYAAGLHDLGTHACDLSSNSYSRSSVNTLNMLFKFISHFVGYNNQVLYE
jgi:hypothetical protein